MMADEFTFPWSETQNYIAEADADVIPVPGQLESHGRCRCGVLLSPCFGALFFFADLIVGWRNSGDRRSLPIAKNHPKTSQEFSEQFGPSTHKMKGFVRIHSKKFTRTTYEP